MADNRTPATELLARSIANLDLESLPERLDDQQLAMVKQVASSQLPSLPPCSDRHFNQCLRVMIAVLPRQGSDDLSGELFVEAYRRQLAGHPADAITYLMDQATRECRWFPTIAECLEILSGWRRCDADVLRRDKAASLYLREVDARRDDESEYREKASMLMSQEQVDALSPQLQRIGLACHALVVDEEGKVRPYRQFEDEEGF
jgi:hypothetical protein